MIVPILEIYKTIMDAKPLFEENNLKSDFFIDLFRGQPNNPEVFEGYSYPAVFIEYNITGQGIDKPRLIQLNLHIEVNENYDASNISPNNIMGMNRFLYCNLLVKIFEGKKLGSSTKLKFENEQVNDSDVVDYHTLVFSFEMHHGDLVKPPSDTEFGEFLSLNFTGKLKQKRGAN